MHLTQRRHVTQSGKSNRAVSSALFPMIPWEEDKLPDVTHLRLCVLAGAASECP